MKIFLKTILTTIYNFIVLVSIFLRTVFTNRSIFRGRLSILSKSKYFTFLLFFGISICGIVFGFQTSFVKNNSAIIKQAFEKTSNLDNANELGVPLNNETSSIQLVLSSNTENNISSSQLTAQISQNQSLSNDFSSSDSSISEDRHISEDKLSSDTVSDLVRKDVTPLDNQNILQDATNTTISTIYETQISSSSNSSTSIKSSSIKKCEFPAIFSNRSSSVILNEIAWMGSPSSTFLSETSLSAQNNEWIELKNTTSKNIYLSGWQIIDSAKNININFLDTDYIAPDSFYLLKRSKDNSTSGVLVDKIYTGALPNMGDKIGIFDQYCSLIDYIDASSSWLGGDNTSKRTLERDLDGVGWHTSLNESGTPKSQNGESYENKLNSSSSIVSSTLSINKNKYTIDFSIVGDGASRITNNSSSVDCGSGGGKCIVSFNENDVVKVKAVPSSNAVFAGWSGACSGSSYECSVRVIGNMTISGFFKNKNYIFENTVTPILVVNDDSNSTGTILDASSSVDQSEELQNSASSSITATEISNEDTIPIDTSQNNLINHLIVFSVQIGGASNSNDYVKVYNPNNSDVQIGGFKLRKKSKTGTDYSIKEFPTGSHILPNGFFVWANSAGDFASSLNADVSSSVELSANNSIGLFDTNGLLIDSVAWGNGSNQYVEGQPFEQNPQNSQILQRIMTRGVPIDTNNNSLDFAIL